MGCIRPPCFAGTSDTQPAGGGNKDRNETDLVNQEFGKWFEICNDGNYPFITACCLRGKISRPGLSNRLER